MVYPESIAMDLPTPPRQVLLRQQRRQKFGKSSA